MRYEQPKVFNPYVLGTGLNTSRFNVSLGGSNNTVINYHKTGFCE